MRVARWALAALWIACFVVGADLPSTFADGANPPPPPPPEWRGARPRAPVPLQPPPGAQQVPVPDVRGMSQADAIRALFEAGLRPGETDRVALEQLEAEHGRRYEPGIVVQQAPRPSVGDSPSWADRGSVVHLRLSEGTAPARAPLPVVPPADPGSQPLPPGVPYIPPTTGGVPAQPPPPSWPGVTPPPAGPGPTSVPYAPYTPYVPPAAQPLDPTPEPIDAALLGSTVRRRTRLACDRGRGSWHFRARGGYAWWLGTDSGSAGAFAGGDLGYTFGDCWGVDVFYRYSSTRFSRTMGGITFQDGGDIHFTGLKATYESAVSRYSDWFFWAGLGMGWVKTRRFANDDSGFGILGETGVGYLLNNSARIRLGVNIDALFTSVGRRLPANDTASRWLTAVAPTLGLELDF